ncbi:MAG: SurA N-terminal domain-containing protein [Bacteroidota bacterium]|nr:SurA N-terminal domain-containing protein [Bacteroidota bacterium]
MSVLESLRQRSGLLVTVVAVALIGGFVLADLFNPESSLFSGSDNVVGEIAGKSIKYQDFNQKVQDAIENQKANSGKATLDDQEMDNIVQQVWNQAINEEVLNKEYEKLGIAVSEDELYDLMVDHPHSALLRNLSDPQTGKINPMFADPQTGQLSPAKIREFTQNMTPEQEKSWAQLENYITQVRIIEKYNNLIKKGMYVTTSASKRDFLAQNTNLNIRYVVKNYKLVADSTIVPTESELNAYYNAHQNEFKQEASRDIEYITFDISPSAEDIEEAKTSMTTIANDFKSKKADEDSAFVISESASRFVDRSYHTPGSLSPSIDTAMFKAEVGTVMGPYEENGAFIISKLTGSKISADSAKVRHILIAYGGSGASQEVTRTKDQAKAKSDSLLAAIKKGSAKFTDMVEKHSDDSGKKKPENKKEDEYYMGKGGDYGWLNAKSGFVDPFKNAGLDGKKGDVVIAESQFGYHIIEVLDSKGAQKKIQVANIDRKVEPSSKTMQAIFLKASEFSGKNNTNELFQKAVVADNTMNKRVAKNIKENDRQIPGVDAPKPLIRWVYENEKGKVSEPLEFGEKFIVASITEVREKGIAPIEQIKEQVTAQVVKEKKAEMFAKEFESAMAGGANIDAIASKLNLAVEKAENVNFNTSQIPGSANEPAVIGAITVAKAQTITKPIAGKEGVFVVFVESKTEAPAQKDYKAQQTQQISALQPRVDYEVYEALKDNANVTEHLVKFGF